MARLCPARACAQLQECIVRRIKEMIIEGEEVILYVMRRCDVIAPWRVVERMRSDAREYFRKSIEGNMLKKIPIAQLVCGFIAHSSI